MGKVVVVAEPKDREKAWDPKHIGFLKPIRYTDHLLVKATYGRLNRLIVRFPRIKVLRAKAAAHGGFQAVYVKVPERYHDIMYDIDESMIEACKQHREGWFGDRSKMLDDFITEFYVPSFVMDRKHGNMLRLHVMPDEDSDEGLAIDKDRVRDISLVFVGLRFNKRTYCTVWKKHEDMDALPETLAWRDESSQEAFDEEEYEAEIDVDSVAEGIVQRTVDLEKTIRDRGAWLAGLLERVLDTRRIATDKKSLESLVQADEEICKIAVEVSCPE